MDLKDELIKGDIEDYQRRIDYLDKIIEKTIKKKFNLEKRLEAKRRLLK